MAEESPNGSFLGSLNTSFVVLIATEDDSLFDALHRSLLPFGYAIQRARTGKEALDLSRVKPPDIIVSEAKLDVLNGFELCQAIKNSRSTRLVPFLFLTSFFDAESKIKALHVGADDFLYKPVHHAELRARLRSLLRNKAYYSRLEHERHHLDHMVRQRTRELDELTIGLVAALEKANSLNDADTGGHIKRVCNYSYVLGKAIGLPDALLQKIRRYASLHDVGKVGLPDRILKKQGPLGQAEREEMKQHTVLGYELLLAAKADPVARNIAISHHERFDGKGYPRGLRGDQIPIEGRIVALADVFDAITTVRCYKTAMTLDEARLIITRDSGAHFDPAVVQAFQAQQRSFRDVYAQYRDLAENEEDDELTPYPW